ncbi:hypothetical protein HYFRA_00013999 [Hymenoscyphus fraxineus]|uniref:Carboxylic ester hydrolase n=1 Tax=Hymenoscyphus fraxineus TaxID=746836 RepID=A0A9N9Q065_9HELO|nr:hypothetical protein HYFRA_00013999 [Hymenoscyphus fraxineus]
MHSTTLGRLVAAASLLDLVSGSPLSQVARQEVTPYAATVNGTYAGIHNEQFNQDYFLGMPFAQPPVGPLRFRNPASLNTSWTGIANATQFSAACPPQSGDNVSEDCLSINVYRPAGYEQGANLPIGLWIYGGGHVFGSNSDPLYNMSYIIQEAVNVGKPFIGITINYRLQAYGYMYGSEVIKAGVGNLGYKDQHLALRWVQENIEAFGGDPTKVTIWGESAGGMSAGALTIAHGGVDVGLFRGAILESAGPFNPFKYTTPQEWDVWYNAIVEAAGCSGSADTLECLRTVPEAQLNAVLNSNVTRPITSFGMEIDGDFIRENAREQYAAGKFVRVPILQGQNHDEGTAMTYRGVNTDEQFLTAVMNRALNNETAMEIARLYPDIPEEGIPATFQGRPGATLGLQYKRISAVMTDLVWHAPRRLQAKILDQYNVPNWGFLFNVLPPGTSSSTGVTHALEIPYVFNNLNVGSYGPVTQEAPQSHKDIARIISKYWINFIVDGDPNSLPPVNQTWPQWTAESPQLMEFNVNKTEVAAPIPDTYRAEGIDYIMANLGTGFGRKR